MRLRAAACAFALALMTMSFSAISRAAESPTAKAHHVIAFFDHHRKAARTPRGQRALWRAIHMLSAEIRTLQAVPPDCRGGASPAACRWYLDGATQCEVSYEGGFTTDSNPTYKGRFQMDYSFETETPFGAEMETRYGRANYWPAWAQIQHAYEVWSYAGWGRWPPYARNGCSAYAGGHYPT